MIYPTLSYPTELRGSGIGFANFVSGIAATLTMWALPSLYTNLGTGVFWVVLTAPVIGILFHLAIRWEVFGYDADSDRSLDVLSPVRAPAEHLSSLQIAQRTQS
ncbi:hypothetical protein AA0488_0149 [Kozakia baliensis NRIC 0488]|nr:hypothetical protein AA0488_0149 [Kozakia baliensis NRIC 0488]GEL64993.1 hypothetical protein KBA01_22790 [Kozakia baliensis]